MSTKRKRNSYSPIRTEVTFVKIYEPDDNPWPQEYYMCGMCGHGIAGKDTNRHATVAHKASSLKLLELYEIDDTVLAEGEAEELRHDGIVPSDPWIAHGESGSGSGGVSELPTVDAT